MACREKRGRGWRLRRLLAAVAGAGALCLSGCGGRMVIPTVEDLVAARAVPRDADLAALARGRALYVTECAACHRLFPPGDYSPQEWTRIIGRMAPRASLDGQQAADLERYLSAASKGR